MTSDQPLIVGIVGNDIVIDTRVKKVAASAARAGFRSTVVCYAPSGVETTTTMGDGIEVIRVPVPFLAKNHPGRVAQPLRPFTGAELGIRHSGPRTIGLAKKRRLEAAITVMAGPGLALARFRLAWMRGVIWLRRTLFRARRRGHITLDRLVRRANLARRRISIRALRPLRNPVANVYDYETTFGPVLEDLQPDVIHAHDFHMIGVAVTAALRLRSSGIPTKVLYDAHELVEGLSYPRDVVDGWLAEEAAYIGLVDAITGVSPEQASRIAERYGLSEPPTVILNAPLTGTVSSAKTKTLRDHVGPGRILVYHGNITEERGIYTLIEALPHMASDIHVAFVVPLSNPLTAELADRAMKARVPERVHILDFVPADELDAFLRSANVAVIPYLPNGNNDIALPNKLFEAIQADLPVLTSNMRALSRFVKVNGVGEVFRAGDPADLAAKADLLLEDIESYRGRITAELKSAASWDAQAKSLTAIYARLTGTSIEHDVHVEARDIVEPARHAEWGDYRPTRLAIGPRNMAGQAQLMCRAVEQHLALPAESFGLETGAFHFEVDHRITAEAWRDPEWQQHQRRLIASRFTHVLTESGTGILGSLNGGFVDEQLQLLRDDDLHVGVLLHGSEIRDPRRHRALPFSPYAEHDELIGRLEQSVARLRRHLEGLDVPVFVTTPDLLEDVDGTWLPVVVDVKEWSSLKAPFDSEIPRVLHLPTNGLLKGSSHVDPILKRLEEARLIEYSRPTGSLSASEVRTAMEQADLVIDGIVLGAYGVMSCQAMAAGRIAIANTSALGSFEERAPIIDANPSTLESTLRALLSDRDSWQRLAAEGLAFVAEYHDGAYTARQLSDFLDVKPTPQ